MAEVLLAGVCVAFASARAFVAEDHLGVPQDGHRDDLPDRRGQPAVHLARPLDRVRPVPLVY